MKLAVAALLLFVLTIPLMAAHAAAQDEPVTALIEGDTAVAPTSLHPYKVTVHGGPAQGHNGTFQIEYVLQGDNVVGGDPVLPRTLANKLGVFHFNVTMPQAEGTIQLFVKVKSGGESANATADALLSIDVAIPIELRATIRNNGAAAALNVTVLFYVDGKLVGNTTVARIDAGGQVTVNVSYIPVGLALGRHQVKVTADLDKDGLIGPGELFATDFFYKTEHSVWPTILWTLTVFIL